MADALRQRIRFTYTTRPDAAATTGAATYNGLEFMQLWPKAADDGLVGIGDFTAPAVNPTDRLDILKNAMRLRDFGTPGLYHDNTLDRILVVDDIYGRVHWRDAATLQNADCEWTMYPSPGPNHVYTATGAPDPDCPDDLEFVGIGTSTPQYKLEVNHTRSTSGSGGGIRSTYLGSATVSNTGISTTLNPENGTNMALANGVVARVTGVSGGGSGVSASISLASSGANVSQVNGVYGSVSAGAGNASLLWGTRGIIAADAAVVGTAYGSYGQVTGYQNSQFGASFGIFGETKNYGTVGASHGGYAGSTWFDGANITTSYGLRATSGPNTQVITMVQNSYGLYASARGGSIGNFSVLGADAGSGTNDWAGWFGGRTYSPTMSWTASDEQLKTDLADIPTTDDDPVDRLLQLNTKSYQFNVDAFPQLGLPTGQQFGFIAQELGEQFPEMVADVVAPPQYDSTGAENTSAVPFKAVNTGGLLPLAIEAIKRQGARITQLEEMFAACCASRDDNRAMPGASANALETDLRIIPNPVADRTELRYTLAEAGRVRLEITDQTGRIVLKREEGSRESASYVYEWDTTVLAPGTYFCTLFVNDEPLVKKAVKLNTR